MARQQFPVPAQGALAAAAKPAGDLMGDSASPAALARLNQAIAEVKAKAVLPLLQRAFLAVKKNRNQEGAEVALKVLEIDERCALGWHVLAICREQAGDFASSLKCYERALELDPNDAAIANNLGRLAYRLGMKDTATALFEIYMQREPGSEAANNLGTALRDQMRFAEAVEVLRPAIQADPANALLWNTLGTVMNEQGQMEQALTFFDEALRLEPNTFKPRYNRGNTRLALGDPQGALEDCRAALPLAPVESEALMARISLSTILIVLGRIGEGWDEYEARLDPRFAEAPQFLIDRPKWEPGLELAGKRLLLIGEQGLGDEVLFANMLPEIIEALGPAGRLIVAVEPRLVTLFQRSFPQAEIGGHATYNIEHRLVRTLPFLKDPQAIDLWAPLGSPLRQFRRTLEAFPDRPAFLTPDPARVEHWRKVMSELGPELKLGLVWKSMRVESRRYRQYSPFEQWRQVLETPGVKFVNLQYGDCKAEIEQARQTLGVEIWDPPFSLKDDLDELAALSCALDLVLGPANASTNIAAACGTPSWLISTPGAWPKLGTERYPWYPRARVFTAVDYHWEPVMAEVAETLAALAK